MVLSLWFATRSLDIPPGKTPGGMSPSSRGWPVAGMARLGFALRGERRAEYATGAEAGHFRPHSVIP